MSNSKTPLSAADYRKRQDQNISKQPTEVVTIPATGNTWELRKLDISAWVLGGELPLHLAQHIENSSKAGDEKEAIQAYQKLSQADRQKFDAFTRKAVEYVTVSPRIRLEPTTDNDLMPSEVDPADYAFLVAYAFSGGALAERLTTFRKKRPVDSLASSHRPKQRDEGEHTDAD